MPIYTRTGDKGTTSLHGGKRVSKSDPQVEAYGSIDELTSYIGLVCSKIKNQESKLFLAQIQRDLYKIMAEISGAVQDLKYLEGRVQEFEKEIDMLEKKLPKLNRFILPGGNELSGWFHVLRTICRKAERNIVRFFNQSTISNQQLAIIKYLNRLSDLFFTLARWYGKRVEILT